MKSAKAIAGAGVAFVAAIVKYVAPDLPDELIALGSIFFSGLLVYIIPNR